ncbi:cytochrome P450 6A1-like [Contarinia nasturtii]|uniref:cytochrome P450 6A1-like n=1 Tax=Contarinia nasturtii TaxID=265458 RepID=UPI0012D454E1|nr:cytochrome P450 6A1-like [Contarinia nasturtii]
MFEMDLVNVLIIVVLIIVTSIWYASYRQRNAFNYWKKRNVPHIEPKIPYGNLEGVGEKFHVVYMIKSLYDKFKCTGVKYFGIYQWRPIAIILDLDLAKDILIKDFANFTDRGLYSNRKYDPLSANLTTMDGDEWKRLRSKLTPAFSSGKLKFMFPTVTRIADRLCDVLNEKITISNKSVDIIDFMMRYTSDVIGNCAFGIECNSLNNRNAEFITMGRLAIKEQRHSPRFLALITSYKRIANILGIKSIRDDVAAFFMHAIQETVEYREKNEIQRNDFMDIMLDFKNKKNTNNNEALTFNEIAAQTNVFFQAGFETSSTTLTNCLYELAKNLDVQNNARNVIRIAYEKYDNQFTYEMMMDLPYIHQIVQETLRKYPISATVNRIAKNDYCVAGTDQVIERNTWIKVPVFGIHHDPEYYPNPEKFDPHRFDSEEVKKRHSMAYLPFGEGPRGCIGARIALMQIYTALVTLLHNFEFLISSDSVDSITFHPKQALLSPKEKVYLKLRPLKSITCK